jgi:hypothetical protein
VTHVTCGVSEVGRCELPMEQVSKASGIGGRVLATQRESYRVAGRVRSAGQGLEVLDRFIDLVGFVQQSCSRVVMSLL